MNERAQSIVERLARLTQFANLFQQELKEVTQLVKDEVGIIVDPASTSPEDMQKILDNLAAHQSNTKPRLASTKTRGEKIGGVLAEFMHPSMISNGEGPIRVDSHFEQYEECVFSTPISRAADWPEGFYRNSTSKETQFLIKGELGEFWLFDGLPGSDVTMLYVDDKDVLPTRTEDMSEGRFTEVMLILKSRLASKISSTYYA